MEGAYDLYYRSGVYERRYPAPNRETLALVARLVAEGRPHVLDFGCGSGRYAVPLALQQRVRLLAYDPCETGIARLRHRADAAGIGSSIRTVSGSLAELRRVAAQEGPVDLALMLFGVLGHIRFRAERLHHLRVVRDLMAPRAQLVVGVPNALRRFQREQRMPWSDPGPREPGDIFYDRVLSSSSIRLFYHLYRPGELEGELSEAGFTPLSTVAESILPEWLIARGRVPAAVDAALRAVTPTRFGYGFLTVAANGRA